jgi:hypothetical protein
MIFELMHKNNKVLSFDISVDLNLFSGLSDIKIHNAKYLPIIFLGNKKNVHNKLYSWLLSRCFDAKRSDFYELTNFLSNNYSNHNFHTVLFCSLCIYGFSLADKYWLNPKSEYLLGNMFDDNPIKFALKPTTYEKLCKLVQNPSDDITNIIKIIFFKKFDKLKEIKHENISLNSPNFTIYGNTIKTWKKENKQWVCEKWYNEKQKEEMLKKMKISDTIKHLNLKHFITYKQETTWSISSNYFLKENEEYIDLSQMLICQPLIDLSDKSIFRIMKKYGLSKKMYNQYLEEKRTLQDAYGIPDYSMWENLGFVINENRKIIDIVSRI